MAEPASKKAEYNDLYAIPDNMIGEIIDGELITSPRPSAEHGYAASIIGSELGLPYNIGRGGPGGWIIIHEPEIAFADNILVPDLAGWQRERFSSPQGHNWIDIIPDWVCEVVSPGSIRLDRVKKMGIYARHGVTYFWLVDPAARTLDCDGAARRQVAASGGIWRTGQGAGRPISRS